MRVRPGILVLLFLALYLQPPAASAVTDPSDLLPDISGYTLEAGLYTYPEYVAMLDEIGVAPSDYSLLYEPELVILASYSKGDTYLWVEINMYDSSATAEAEQQAQHDEQAYDSVHGWCYNNGPLFQRFTIREKIYRQGQFIMLYFYSPADSIGAIDELNSLLPTFIGQVHDAMGMSPSEPPSSAVDAEWGIQPGDVITWGVEDSSFIGGMGTGHSQSQDEWAETWTVEDIVDGHVLVSRSDTVQYIYAEDEIRYRLDMPVVTYTWHTPTDGAISLMDADGDHVGPAIYPLSLNGAPLAALMEDAVDHLPETDSSESTTHLSVSGTTPQYSGFTPVETQWMDLTVHKGSGIVTYSEFYYNNNEYQITTSTHISLQETSFSLDSRVAVTPELTAVTELSHQSLEQGTPLTVTVQVTDQDGAQVTDATVTATVDETLYTLIHQGSGTYTVTIETGETQPSSKTVTVTAEKAGHQPASDASSFTVEAARQPEPEQTGGGIPGYPAAATLLGTAAALIWQRRKRLR
ncbi:hypothetical protein JXL21_01355 [Candidatus Bathyarchaeota archaeon]|nr:hypothetical protein [Candidatus Bathyarchaeota archaeon]